MRSFSEKLRPARNSFRASSDEVVIGILPVVAVAPADAALFGSTGWQAENISAAVSSAAGAMYLECRIVNCTPFEQTNSWRRGEIDAFFALAEPKYAWPRAAVKHFVTKCLHGMSGRLLSWPAARIKNAGKLIRARNTKGANTVCAFVLFVASRQWKTMPMPMRKLWSVRVGSPLKAGAPGTRVVPKSVKSNRIGL